jgi:hypothetical protein
LRDMFLKYPGDTVPGPDGVPVPLPQDIWQARDRVMSPQIAKPNAVGTSVVCPSLVVRCGSAFVTDSWVTVRVACLQRQRALALLLLHRRARLRWHSPSRRHPCHPFHSNRSRPPCRRLPRPQSQPFLRLQQWNPCLAPAALSPLPGCTVRPRQSLARRPHRQRQHPRSAHHLSVPD